MKYTSSHAFRQALETLIRQHAVKGHIMSNQRDTPKGKFADKFPRLVNLVILFLLALFLFITTSCGENPAAPKEVNTITTSRSPRLGPVAGEEKRADRARKRCF